MNLRFFRSWGLRAAALVLLLGGGAALHAAEEFLDPDQAFKLEARAVDARQIELAYTAAPGYYLYHEQFKWSAVTPGVVFGAPVFPPGKVKFDETFQKNVETHRGLVKIVLPVQSAPATFVLDVASQGCADKGLCYPPATHRLEVKLAGFGGSGTVRELPEGEPVTEAAGASPSTTVTGSPSDGSDLGATLRDGRLWPVLGVFFIAGLLLSLTPCVLPMLPILSSIIVGQGAQVSRGRGLALAASYSLGMALIYTALGVAAGLAGQGLAAALQNAWVLGFFALGLVAFALSMFGVYELRPPAALACRLNDVSRRLPGGRMAGVFAMGGLSALIVSPCVAAPLAGALVYLSQSRDVWLGGSALFSLAIGMSVPLLLVGASAGALLPRAGGWMEQIKRLFGVVLLGMALWTVQVLLYPRVVLLLWGALLALAAFLVLRTRRQGVRSPWVPVSAAVLAACGLLQVAGAATGGADPLRPWAPLAARLRGEPEPTGPAFRKVTSVAELDAALRDPGRPVMLDFWADWCVSCKEMERFTFTDPAVQKKLAGAVLLKADVTANSAADQALLKRFGLFGPPGTIFFDAQGREVTAARVVGYQNSDRFRGTLESAGL